MNSKIKQVDSRLLIQDNPHYLRLLIGLPFFVGSAYFLYHLGLSIIEYVLNASLAEWITALPGVFAILLFAFIVLLPGLFLVSKESIVVNKAQKVIAKRRELMNFHTRGKIVSLDQVVKVTCRRQTRKHTDRSVGSTSGRTNSATYYLIDLVLENNQTETLIEYSEKSDAKKIAKMISSFAELALDDRL